MTTTIGYLLDADVTGTRVGVVPTWKIHFYKGCQVVHADEYALLEARVVNLASENRELHYALERYKKNESFNVDTIAKLEQEIARLQKGLNCQPGPIQCHTPSQDNREAVIEQQMLLIRQLNNDIAFLKGERTNCRNTIGALQREIGCLKDISRLSSTLGLDKELAEVKKQLEDMTWDRDRLRQMYNAKDELVRRGTERNDRLKTEYQEKAIQCADLIDRLRKIRALA